MLVVVRRSASVLLVVIVLGAVALFVRGDDQLFAVRTGSMMPAYQPGDLVVDRPASSGYRVGDVITFRSTSGPDEFITHRVVAVDGKTIHTKGDANSTPDPGTTTESDVVGKVVRHVPNGGFALLYLKQPTGAASILFMLMGLMLAWSICFPTESEEAADQEQEALMKFPQMVGT
jgi:signal peptidase